MKARLTFCLLALTAAVPRAVAALTPHVPAGANAGAGSIQFITVGEPVVAVGGFGFAHTVSAAAVPPVLDPGPFLSRLVETCGDAKASGKARLVGDMAANGDFDGNGQAVVQGNVTAAKIRSKGNAVITGTQSEQLNAITCAPVALPPILQAAQAANDNSSIPPQFLDNGVLTLSGSQALTLPAGTYLLQGLAVDGEALLATAGQVGLFVRGPITVSGKAVVNAGATTDFVVYSDSADDISLSGQSATRAVVYAPAAKVKTAGQASLHGHLHANALQVVGGSLDVQNPTPYSEKSAAEDEPLAAAPETEEEPKPDKPSQHEGAEVIAKITGGRVEAKVLDGVTGRERKHAAVVVPPGALKADQTITIGKPEANALEDGRKLASAQAKGLLEISEPVEYGPEGTTFDAPVTLEIAYDPGGLPGGVDEDDLHIHYWNPVRKEWELLADSQIDRANRVVRATTNHFSLYQVLAALATPAAGAEDFRLREVYVFPNPAVGGQIPTIHVAVGRADEVDVRIYDLSGRQVHAQSFGGTPTVLGSEFAYEFVWDQRIPSGVYFYVVEARKSGYRPLRKAGKFAVVR